MSSAPLPAAVCAGPTASAVGAVATVGAVGATAETADTAASAGVAVCGAERRAGLLLVANLLLLAAVAVGLRAWRLDHIPGINGDEAWYAVRAHEWAAGALASWRTPTGNPLNPLFIVPVAVAQSWLPSSFVAVRAVALASGLAALVLNAWLCRLALGRGTAVISTTALAVLPINIAYSRFGWDTSQSLAAGVLVVYPALCAADPRRRCRPWLATSMVALACAMLVHPTNVFLAPILATAWWSRWAQRNRAARTERTEFAPRTPRTPHQAPAGDDRPRQPAAARVPRPVALLAAGTLALAAGLAITTGHAAATADGLATVFDRLTPPGRLPLFIERCGQLFTGVTVYRFIPGWGIGAPGESWPSVGWIKLFDAAWYAAAVPLLVAAGAALRDPAHLQVVPSRCDEAAASPKATEQAVPASAMRAAARRGQLRALVAGLLIGLAGFFLIGGPGALAPHFERYGLWLVVPVTLVLSCGLERLLSPPELRGGPHGKLGVAAPDARRWLRACYLMLAWLALAAFWTNYMLVFERTGGRSHRTFRTAATEPKTQAFALVKDQRRPGETYLVAESWWLYWPLRYLAGDEEQLHVVDHLSAAPFVAAIDAGRTWWIGFAETADHARARAWFQSHELAFQEQLVCDYAGRPLLAVLGPAPATSFDAAVFDGGDRLPGTADGP